MGLVAIGFQVILCMIHIFGTMDLIQQSYRKCFSDA